MVLLRGRGEGGVPVMTASEGGAIRTPVDTPAAAAPRWRRAAVVELVAVVSAGALWCAAAGAAVASTCTGDCNDNGAVSIDELLKGVNISLGTLPLEQCPRFDCDGTGQVSIGCLVAAVSASLTGCPPPPTGSPTATSGTPASTDTPLPVSTPSLTGSATLTPTATATPPLAVTMTGTATATPSTELACGTFLDKFGSPGSGDGQFIFPQGIAVDRVGNVFVADTGNDRIEKFTNGGAFLRQWGGTGGANGQLHDPQGLAVDGDGNVFVADSGNNRVQKFDNDGAFLTSWGAAGSGDGQFSAPNAVAVDGSRNVFVADSLNNRIEKFTSAGAFLTKWGSVGSADGQFASPVGIAVDGDANVYVADLFNNRIQKFTATGAFLTTWGSTGDGDGQFINARAVAVDDHGRVFTVDDGHDRIEVFTNTGDFLATWGSLGTADGQFNSATGVAVDPTNGNVLVTEENQRVQRFACSPSASRFVDNGDGTISDTQTGLMWEKKDESGGLHDVSSLFPWTGVCTDQNGVPCSGVIGCTFCQPDATAERTCTAATGGAVGCARCPGAAICQPINGLTTVWQWLNQINAANFAGHNDWRIPTIGRDGGAEQLETIVDTSVAGCGSGAPCVAAAFNTSCASGCAASDCSCTDIGQYWSATTIAEDLPLPSVWSVLFFRGTVGGADKTSGFFVRAVRSPGRG